MAKKSAIAILKTKEIGIKRYKFINENDFLFIINDYTVKINSSH